MVLNVARCVGDRSAKHGGQLVYPVLRHHVSYSYERFKRRASLGGFLLSRGRVRQPFKQLIPYDVEHSADIDWIETKSSYLYT